MNKVSYRVALGGVISSLCLLAMFMTGVMPFLYLTLPMIAGALMTIIVVEVNVPWAFLTYIAVSILSLFVTFDKEAALIFILLFGHYPIIKQKIEGISLKPVKFFIKFGVFNVCAVLDYQLTIHLLGIADFADDFSVLGKWGIYIFWICANIIFFLYDYALGGCIEMYNRYLKPKIFGGKKKNEKK
ncbi:MAG: hypothetical protein ACI4I9_10170 [Porcipelethomonas sp.]